MKKKIVRKYKGKKYELIEQDHINGSDICKSCVFAGKNVFCTKVKSKQTPEEKEMDICTVNFRKETVWHNHTPWYTRLFNYFFGEE